MPPPITRCVCGSKRSLVKPSSRPSASERPLAAQGNTAFSKAMSRAFASRLGEARPRRSPGPCRQRRESPAHRSDASVRPRPRRRPSPSCVALCASIGWPDDVADREDVRHVGAHLPVDRDEAAFVDVRRRRPRTPIAWPFGERPTATSTLSKTCGPGACCPRMSRAGPPRSASTCVTPACRA